MVFNILRAYYLRDLLTTQNSFQIPLSFNFVTFSCPAHIKLFGLLGAWQLGL